MPVSVKGVLIVDDSVLLGRNDRDEWELPGGRLERGESLAAALQRELLEETGLRVRALDLLTAEVFEVVPGTSVLAIAYGCATDDTSEPVPSREHRKVRFVPLVELRGLRLPDPYRRAIGTAIA